MMRGSARHLGVVLGKIVIKNLFDKFRKCLSFRNSRVRHAQAPLKNKSKAGKRRTFNIYQLSMLKVFVFA